VTRSKPPPFSCHTLTHPPNRANRGLTGPVHWSFRQLVAVLRRVFLERHREIPTCPAHVFGPTGGGISMSYLRRAIPLVGFTALSWWNGMAALSTLSLPGVMSFFHY
jgi:hypothetical protein